MNPSPEEQEVGKVNFQAVIGSRLVRRDFLMGGIKKGVSRLKGLGAMYYGYDAKMSEPVRVGVLGTGDEGSVLLGAINPDYVTVVSLADVRPYNQYRAFEGDYDSPNTLKARPGLNEVYKKYPDVLKNIKQYGRYQDLIAHAKEDKVEAVIIALPLHLHAPAAIAAMKAGLHVLTEKLMGHSVRECKEMALVSEMTKRFLATGHQRHYSILYDNAMEVIKKGLLGDLHYIRAQWHRGNMPGTDSWQQPMPNALKPDDEQADRLTKELAALRASLEEAKKEKKTAAEIETWGKKIKQKEKQITDEVLKNTAVNYGYKDADVLNDAREVVYHRPAAEELIRWRLWERTGGGLMAELGSHQLDAASLFISAMHGGNKQYPLSVMAAANRPLFPADRDAEDHVYCLFEFPAPEYFPKDGKKGNPDAKITVQYSSINGNGFGGYGETVLGSEGTLLLETEKDVLLYKGSDLKSKARVVEDKETKKPVLKAEAAGDPESAAIGQLGILPNERGYTAEIEHWAWCIRNGDAADPQGPKPRCHPKVAMGDAVIALTTNIAAREGGRINFNPDWFDFHKEATPEGKKPDIKRYE